MRFSGAHSFQVLSACLLSSCLCYAGLHPVPVDEHSDCLQCHGEYAASDYIHPAVKRGCVACHTIEKQGSETYIVLRSSRSLLCFDCHRPEIFQHEHFPYSSGMCLRCHNPHGSGNSRLLRAKVNDLCLQCHLRNPDEVPSRFLPTIALSLNNSMGHPYERHPVAGSRDPLTGDEKSCISCHRPHGSTKLHCLKMGAEIPEDALNQNTETKDMCHKCHLILWGLDGKAGKKGKKKKGN